MLIERSFASAVEAEGEYIRAISIESTLLDARLDLGMLYMGMYYRFPNTKDSNALENSEKEFLKVIKLDPRNFEAHKCLGTVMTWVKNYENAEMYFRKTLKLCSIEQAKLIEWKLAYVLEKMGKIEEAIEHYEKIFPEYDATVHVIEHTRGVVEPDKEDPTKGRYHEIGFKLLDKNTGQTIKTEPYRNPIDWID